MRRIFTTALAIALMGGAALSAPAVAADQGRPTGRDGQGIVGGQGTSGVPTPAEALELTPEPAAARLRRADRVADPHHRAPCALGPGAAARPLGHPRAA